MFEGHCNNNIEVIGHIKLYQGLFDFFEYFPKSFLMKTILEYLKKSRKTSLKLKIFQEKNSSPWLSKQNGHSTSS